MVLIKNIEYVYTDGSVVNAGKSTVKGGSGVFFGTDDPRNMALRFRIEPVTINRAELFAIYKALEMYIKTNWKELNTGVKLSPRKKLFVYTDSLLSVNIVQKWMDSWANNGWKKNGGIIAPENLDLIKAIYHIKKYYIKHLQIKLIHVKAHREAPPNINTEEYLHWYGNYMADKLASMGRRSN